jgi:hypothetical protein
MENDDDSDDKNRDRGEPVSDRLTESIRQRLEQLVPELVRKTFTAGMGAVYQTEDSLRKVAKDMNLPNLPNVAGYLASSADATKDKVLEVIARETREFLEHINLGDEIAKLLTTLSFEIKTEVRFIPNSERFGGAEPDIKSSVRLKRDSKSDVKGDAKTEPKGKPADDDGKDDNKEDKPSRLRFWKRDDDNGNQNE